MILLLISLSALCALLQFPIIQDWVVWDSSLIEAGQWWRIVTGNLTHTNLAHLAMNLAGLWIITHLFKPKPFSLVFITLLNCFAIGLLLLSTDMQQYVGLSGVLHGIFAFYALQEVFSGRKSSWLLVVGIIIKVGHEQLYGAPSSTIDMINAPVAIQAHLFGLLIGFIAAIMMKIYLQQSANTSLQ